MDSLDGAIDVYIWLGCKPAGRESARFTGRLGVNLRFGAAGTFHRPAGVPFAWATGNLTPSQSRSYASCPSGPTHGPDNQYHLSEIEVHTPKQ